MLEKKKLSIDQQIEDLKNKGVTFINCSEEDTKKYLRRQNYYFKYKSYAKNYVINKTTGKYVNLDASYLMELASIDLKLRKVILEMCLDIEHYLKVRFLNDIVENDEEDGFNIVSKFRASDTYNKVDMALDSEVTAKSICTDLAQKYKDQPEKLSAWNVVELLSLGAFADFYGFYYLELYPHLSRQNYSRYLGAIKFLRNAAAHNNALISSIRTPRGQNTFNKTEALTSSLGKNLSGYQKLEHRSKLMDNPVIHDFIAMLCVYYDLLRVPELKEKRARRFDYIYRLFLDEDGEILKHKEYFAKNRYLCDAYEFVAGVLKLIYNRINGPGSGKALLL